MLLEKGELLLMNPAESKGRRAVVAPPWGEDLKQKAIELIRPDSERFLASTGRSSSTWVWD